MNIVDSCGWFEYLSDGKNAKFFENPLLDTDKLLVPTILLYEVTKKVLKESGEDKALQVISLMYQGKVIELDCFLAVKAAKVSLDYKIPFADSVILATSLHHKAVIWTQDEHFEKIKGIKYIKKRN